MATLTEIADRIHAHLKRFEADPKINAVENGLRPYYYANAGRAGSRVFVTYITYQGNSSLTKDEALAYLQWLDAGHVGRHWEQQRERRKAG